MKINTSGMVITMPEDLNYDFNKFWESQRLIKTILQPQPEKIEMNDYEGFGLTKDEQELMSLADEMASAMAGLNSQTYDTFVMAREKFRLKVKKMVDKQKTTDERIAAIKKAVEAA